MGERQLQPDGTDEWWRTYYDDAYEWMMEHARPAEEVERQAAVISGALARYGFGRGTELLDAPCAGGAIAVELAARYGFQVTGVDLEPRMIEIATGRAHARGVKGITFRCADICSLDAQPMFDAAINWFTSLGYSTDPDDDRSMLRAMARTLRPGGVLVVDVDCISPATQLEHHNEYRFDLPGGHVSAVSLYDDARNVFSETQTIVAPFGSSTRETQIKIYTPDELRSLVEDAGLEVCELEVGDAVPGRTPRAFLVGRA